MYFTYPINCIVDLDLQVVTLVNTGPTDIYSKSIGLDYSHYTKGVERGGAGGG